MRKVNSLLATFLVVALQMDTFCKDTPSPELPSAPAENKVESIGVSVISPVFTLQWPIQSTANWSE